jgi:hypothetical protein
VNDLVEKVMAELEGWPGAGFVQRPPVVVVVREREYRPDTHGAPLQAGERARAVFVIPDEASQAQVNQLLQSIEDSIEHGRSIAGLHRCTIHDGKIGYITGTVRIEATFANWTAEQIARHSRTKDGYDEVFEALQRHLVEGHVPPGLRPFALQAVTNPKRPRKGGVPPLTEAYRHAVEFLAQTGLTQRTRVENRSDTLTACDVIAEAATRLGVPETYDTVRKRTDPPKR